MKENNIYNIDENGNYIYTLKWYVEVPFDKNEYIAWPNTAEVCHNHYSVINRNRGYERVYFNTENEAWNFRNDEREKRGLERK